MLENENHCTEINLEGYGFHNGMDALALLGGEKGNVATGQCVAYPAKGCGSDGPGNRTL